MPKVFLVHGWEGNPNNSFFPWLRSELESRDYEVESLSMPDPDNPRMEAWIPHLEQAVGTPSKDVVIVGHSMGGATTLRFLERLPEGIKIDKAVLVAPAVDIINNLTDEEAEFISPWLKPFDDAKIARSADKIIGIFSDNDQFIPLSSADYAKEHFSAEIVIDHEMSHYDDDTGITEAPSVLQAILD